MSKGTKTGGGAKDSTNKTTAPLKEAIIDAAKSTGRDGCGKEELTGYCCKLAREEPKAFATLLGRVLPMQLTGADGDPLELLLQEISGNAVRPREAR